LNKSATNIPSACRIATIGLNHAMILPHDANPGSDAIFGKDTVMQIPVQVTFEGAEPSEAVRSAIEREVERLEKHNHHIIGCRVAVIAPSHKHHHGTGFHIHIWLTVPPHENIVVNHVPSEDRRHEHVEVAIKDAFASARRQVDDLAQSS
jgi:ribosome-associated translation inhibitor RaiA